MVKLNKLYTKNGDLGFTHLTNRSLVVKYDLRIQCCGEIDELNCFLGKVLVSLNEKKIQKQILYIQNQLFNIGAELATKDLKKVSKKYLIKSSDVKKIEKWIDNLTKDLPELKSFVLPGGSLPNSEIHIARAVCRRAERKCWELNSQEKISKNLLIYLNRLSDYLFALSRKVLADEGIEEVLWKP